MSKYAKFSGTEATQMQAELASFITLLQKTGCQSYLEIGARCGDTFRAVMMALPVGSVGVAVDLPNNGWGEERSEDKLRNVCRELRDAGYRASCILGSSRNLDVIEQARLFAPFDAVFIDGDHSLEGVTADYNNYKTMAKKLISFHDIAWKPDGNCHIGVPELWGHLSETHEISEFIAKDSRMGIGVLHVSAR